jgi:murein DD-endopeptidase MepM/ murein hydrolase activator NlpD
MKFHPLGAVGALMAGALALGLGHGEVATAEVRYAPLPADVKPVLGLPFATPPGLDTWLVGQSYGNTVGAYLRRREWYAGGQGVHFGIDFSARCGTPVVALADGVVRFADNMSHGSAPHNLAISHDALGYVAFYGHLLERPNLAPGTRVKKGDVVGRTGDPDETCTSRPHLHLEVRDPSMTRAYNPHLLIDTDWDALQITGAFGRGFERNLDDPRKWQTIYDQPDIQFGGVLINEYPRGWPQDWR